MDSHKRPPENLIKETYAHFGLAYYLSECVHRELCHIHAFASFESHHHITRPRMEEKLAYAYSLTLGQLKEQLKKELPHNSFPKLEMALERRNFLAHHFWFERAHLMFSIESLEKMIAELESMESLFSSLNEELSQFASPKYKKLGLTEEIVQHHLEAAKSGEQLDPLPNKRRPQKEEKLVCVWEVTLPNGEKPLIFETEDGCLWQLCDIGLGWTYYEKSRHNWKIVDDIQKYLPATINPRPRGCQPWNYEFNLSKGATFGVRLSNKEKTFRWGIKARK